MKKGFASKYLLMLFIIILTLLQIYQFKINSYLMLKKYQVEHLLKIKVYQLIKRNGLKEFEIIYRGIDVKAIIVDNYLEVSYLNKKFLVEYDSEKKLIK